MTLINIEILLINNQYETTHYPLFMKIDQPHLYPVVVYMFSNNKTHKNYIGTTINPLTNRLYHHIWESKNHTHIRSKFHRALRKYGIDCWTTSILYCCVSREDGLKAEIELIKDYDTFKNGYNTTPGGDCGPILCGKDNGMSGRTHTNKVKQRLAKFASKRFRNKTYVSLYGIDKAMQLKETRSQDIKKYLKQNPRHGKNNTNAKRYQFIDPSGKEYVIEGGLVAFCKQHKLYVSGIIDIAKGKRSHYKNWKASLLT